MFGCRLACSFCRRSHTEVDKLVAGSRVYICDRCVAIAADLMRGETSHPAAPAVRTNVMSRLVAAIRQILTGANRVSAEVRLKPDATYMRP
jgi:ATP-dependent protease Clp ATPase subunit